MPFAGVGVTGALCPEGHDDRAAGRRLADVDQLDRESLAVDVNR